MNSEPSSLEQIEQSFQEPEIISEPGSLEQTEPESLEQTDTEQSEQWSLAITKEQFSEIYGEAMDPWLFSHVPDTDFDLIEEYLPSKLWRMNNLYTIVNKKGTRVPFKMNYAQHLVYAASLQHPRLIILKSRQQGISTFWLVNFFDDAMMLPDLNIGLMAQGLDESSTLLKRVKLSWETFPEDLKEFLQVGISRDNSQEVAMRNGCSIFIRTSFRSATLQRLHISEYGKISSKTPERAIETKTGTLQTIQAGLPVIIESTAEGDNDFKRMWYTALEAEAKVLRLGTGVYPGKDFKPVFLSWLNDPDCSSDVYEEESEKQSEYFAKLEDKLGIVITEKQRNFWIAQYRELGERIYQEYPATPEEAFEKVNAGTYYATLYHKMVIKRGREMNKLYDPNLEVHVAMDLGMSESDVFTLGYFQVWRGEARLIAEYTNHGEGLEHYVNHMNDTGYTIGWVIAPHDIAVRELGTGYSRKRRLSELGVRRIMVIPKLSVSEGIEQVRALLLKLWIDPSCEYLIGCFKNYSREWDERNNTWKSKANHNSWSHGADMLRMFALSGLVEGMEVPLSGRQVERESQVVDGLAM